MNQHSQIASEQRTRILEAARRCFVRSGFHRATMQDVAAEAGMSAGNIYRYFKSKDDVVAALCALDRAGIAASFADLADQPDPLAAFIAIGERHLVQESRDQAILALDLWAESARSARIDQICREFDADIRRWIGSFLGRMAANGQAVPDLDVARLVDLLVCIGDGLLARKAREAGFDPTPHLAQIADLVSLACAGLLPSMRTGTASGDKT